MSTTLQDLQRQVEIEQYSPGDEDIDNKTATMEANPAVRFLLSSATGILFGIAIEKGRVFDPQVIRDQMLFKRFTMLKMFLSATAIGLLCFSLMSSLPQSMRKLTIALQRFIEAPPAKSVFGVFTGALLLGSGMAIAGACPGVVLVQIGTGVSSAWITVAGGLLGALSYAFISSSLPSVFIQKTKFKFHYLNYYLDIPYVSIAVPFSCTMAAAVMGLELYSPWYTEVDESLLTDGVMNAGAWPPFIAGVFIGALQLPTVLVNEDTLGSSSSYVTIVSKIPSLLHGDIGEGYLKQFRFGLKNWWQVFHVSGAVFGGFLSATASSTYGTVLGVPGNQAFLGGFLMLFGARLAGGCTSGHGLSGMGLLAFMSFVAVPAMFGGGIATAFFMRDVLGVEM